MRGFILMVLFGLLTINLRAQEVEWKNFETPVKASLRGLSPVSDLICWASGSGGTWLKTLDGGQTWSHGIIAGLDSVDFRSIHAFDANSAVVASAGQPSLIFKTTDGGQTWEKVHQEGPEAFFDAIFFLDEKNGFVLGDPVGGFWMVLKTIDGGNTWQTMEDLPQAFSGEAAFAASSSSMIADKQKLRFATGGTKARIHSFDFINKKWSVLDLSQMAQGEASKGVFAMTTIDDEEILVGGDYVKPEVIDGNSLLLRKNGAQLPAKAPNGYRSGVAYGRKNRIVIAVGPTGSDVSMDGGVNWMQFSNTGFHSVKASTDQKAIWASGSQGRIALLLN